MPHVIYTNIILARDEVLVIFNSLEISFLGCLDASVEDRDSNRFTTASPRIKDPGEPI